MLGIEREKVIEQRDKLEASLSAVFADQQRYLLASVTSVPEADPALKEQMANAGVVPPPPSLMPSLPAQPLGQADRGVVGGGSPTVGTAGGGVGKVKAVYELGADVDGDEGEQQGW